MNILLQWLLIVIGMIASVIYAKWWCVMNSPAFSLMVDNWITALLTGRRLSTQFFICYIGLMISSYMIWVGIQSQPTVAEFYFPFYGMALLFILVTMLFAGISAVLAFCFGIVEAVRSLRINRRG